MPRVPTTTFRPNPFLRVYAYCNTQILFVDDSHTLRARVSEGLLNRIAEWNGFGRALYADSCGLEATHGEHLGVQEAATLMAEGGRFKMDTHIVRAPKSSFAPELLDHYDLILAMVTNAP
eukprot:2864369-Pyramimonas_sp.AAC.1